MKKIEEIGRTSFFPPWVIKSKLEPTRQMVGIIDRPALIKKINACLDLPLSFVCAPGGYGKSTLMSSWRERLVHEGLKVCWLSIDQDDNDSFQFLTYVALSLYESGIDFDVTDESGRLYLKDMSARNLLSLIVRSINKQSEKIILMLDDFDRLDRHIIDEVVMPLINYSSDNLHICISSRTDENIKMANLEVQGLVEKFCSSDLCFTIQEIESFFQGEITKNQIQRIYNVTEGWPVSIQILKGRFERTRNIEKAITDIESSSGVLSVYLNEQIFESLTEEIKQFLMDISIEDRVSVEFANYIRNSDDGDRCFLDSGLLGSLILPVGDDKTFRIHPIFKEYLNEKLVSSQTDRSVEIYVKAAEWFSGKGDIVKGVHYCTLADNNQHATKIVERAGGIRIWLKEGISRLRSVLAMMDEKTIYSSRQLIIIQCLINIKDGSLSRARSDFDRYFDGNVISEKNTEDFDIDVVLLEGLLSIYEGNLISDDVCLRLRRVESSVSPIDHLVLGYSYNILFAYYSQSGNFQESKLYADKALLEYRKVGSIYGEIFIDFHLGGVAFSGGDKSATENYYQSGLKLIRQHFSDDKRLKLISNILFCECRYEFGESLPSSSAKSILGQLKDGDAWFDIYAAGYITASNIEFDNNGLKSAFAVLDKAKQHADNQNLTHLNRLILAQRKSLYIRSGYIDKAVAVSAEIDRVAQSNYCSSWREAVVSECSDIMLLMTSGDYKEALSRIEHLECKDLLGDNYVFKIRVDALKVQVFIGLGEFDRSANSLNRLLVEMADSGYLRTFINSQPDINKAIEILADKGFLIEDHGLSIYKSLSGMSEQEDVELLKNQELSKREMDVLRQLKHGYSNKIIAREIDISENTVRFHLKNIFSKLGVDNRMQAVSEAQRRGVI